MNGSGWEVAAAGFAASLAGRAPATVDGYVKHVMWLRDAVHEDDPWEVTPQQLQVWLDGQGWSVATRRKVLVSLRAFYGHGLREGLCARSPLAGLAVVPARKRGPRKIEAGPLWVDPIAGFLVWLEAGARMTSTIEQRRWWLIRLSETYADPWAVTAQDLALWLSREDYAPETKRLARSTVQTFYQWAEIDGHVTVSPARHLSAIRVPRALPRPTPTETLREALDVDDERVRLAVMLAAYAGLRRAEIARVHTRDVGDDRIHVIGKGGNERLVPLHPDLRVALRSELRRRRDGAPGVGWGATEPRHDGWLFPSDDPDRPLTAAHLGKLIARALPGAFTTHTLRHRFATQAYQAGRDLRAVQELMGHAAPETTARYAAVPDGALEAAVAGVGL